MRKSVLVVNANNGMRFLLKTVLSPAYNLVHAGSIFDGITALRTKKNISAFIIDIDTHTEDCLEFVSLIQDSILYKYDGIILTNEPAFAEKYIKDSENKCVVLKKPFNPASLTNTLETIVAPKPVLA